MSNDPFDFDDPDEIPSEFASIDSFRGRVVLITPTDFNPNNRNDNDKLMPKFTATITTVDGKGKVPQFKDRVATGTFLTGPRHEGVWLTQERIVKSLRTAWERKTSVIGVPETYKPGQRAGKGNPWDLLKATDDQKKTAREFLANMTVSAAAEPEDDDPFKK